MLKEQHGNGEKMQHTKIDWVNNKNGKEGYVWNPVTGCLHGCPYCYARKMAARLKGRYGYPVDDPFRPTFHADKIREPDNLKTPSKIFVCSMSDLFGEWIPRDWIVQVRDTVEFNPLHTFIFLTKNPKRYSEFNFPKNAWLGYSTTGPLYHEWDSRHKQNIKFISVEPMMGEIVNTAYLHDTDWIILGAETGNRKGRVEFNEDWKRQALEICHQNNISLFVKNNAGGGWQEYPK
jgi:protein gp37